MRKHLHIGEVAQLLGITPKAIRHYQKLELLEEPARSPAGYRLYDTRAILRLHQIKQLQALGLPLKRIRALLGRQTREQPLHVILQALDAELTAQIQELEARRARIRELLSEGPLEQVEQLPASSRMLQQIRQQLEQEGIQVHPAIWEIETKVISLLEDFRWPISSTLLEQFRLLMHEQPELWRHLLSIYSRLSTTLEASADGELLLQDQEIQALITDVVKYLPVPEMQKPFTDAFAELMLGSLSPQAETMIQLLKQALLEQPHQEP
uniref:HTH merR-type domain-containing protein n=1 Tax=Thermosporothrix sp. COM3 TaxID=2490863 RepID=A0A455SER3_9CHLR|nr:hypothetical protein KTC_05620 [Thermosporothrix sp. COM3]